MTYLISTDIRGFSYYVRIKGEVPKSTRDFTFEGLMDNATEFYSYQDATEVLGKLKTNNNLFITP